MRPLKFFAPSIRPTLSSTSARAGISAVALALAASLGVAGAPAFAQTAAAPEHHRAHRTGGEGMEILKLRSRLNLSADQSAALDAIVAAARSQGAALRASSQAVVAQINAELANAQPNLQAVAQLRDSLQGPRETLRKATRDQLIGFYGTLNATQQQVVIDALRKAAARHAAFAAAHAAS